MSGARLKHRSTARPKALAFERSKSKPTYAGFSVRRGLGSIKAWNFDQVIRYLVELQGDFIRDSRSPLNAPQDETAPPHHHRRQQDFVLPRGGQEPQPGVDDLSEGAVAGQLAQK